MNKLLALVALIVVVGFIYMQYGSDSTETADVSEESNVSNETAAGEEVVAEESANADAPSDTAVAVTGDAALGAALYEETCLRCHGAGAAGLASFNGELERLQFMLNGGSAYMPDFTGWFTDDEIINIHAYLTSDER